MRCARGTFRCGRSCAIPARASRLASWGAELATGDVTDAASLRAACEGVDAVVHQVAIIKGSKQTFERVMEQGTRNVVAAAQEAGVRRFVLASALGLDERSKDAVPYFAAKWQMEKAVRESGLEHVIFRPSFVFGSDGGVLPTFIRLARYAPVTPIIGAGPAALAADLGRGSRRVLRARARPSRRRRIARSTSAVPKR